MVVACTASQYTSSSLCNLAGAMPASVGKKDVRVGRNQPATICMVLLKATSNLFVCALQNHAGVSYSAAFCTQW